MTQTQLGIIGELVTRGLSIIPIEPRGKRPAIAWKPYQNAPAPSEQVERWFHNGCDYNVGIVTGEVSGVVAVDCDSPEAIEWADAHLPATPMKTRTSRGEHRFYGHPGRPVRNRARIRTGDALIALDVRGDGGFVVGPGSIHQTGVVYQQVGDWTRPLDALPVFDPSWLEPDKRTDAPIVRAAVRPAPPDRAQVLLRAQAYLAATPPAIEGQAGDTHTYQVCCRLVRGFDLSDAEAFDELTLWNQGCLPPWSDAELRTKIESARRYGDEVIGGRLNNPTRARTVYEHPPGSSPSRKVEQPRNGGPQPSADVRVVAGGEDRLTEAGAAQRFGRLHGDDVRFDHHRGRWLLWQGHRWAPDTDGGITRLGLDFARTWQRESVEIVDRDRKEAAFKAAVKLERREALRSMLALAADLRPIADAGDGWDMDAWLLGTPAGVVDLRTGRLRPGRREDRITMSTNTTYDLAAKSDRWVAALRSILLTDETIEFVQTAIGYSATGDTRRDCWFLNQGKGRNGKGTLLHPARRALGDYAAELPAAVFAAGRDTAPYDLAVLPGKRFVVSSESGDTIKLHHDRIKQLTGGDPMRAANKYEKSFEFQPACKLWLSANRTPRVSDDSPAFWARVMLIPFTVSFAGREDRNLRPMLEYEPEHQAAILAWIIQGAVRYYGSGLQAPDPITQATSEYQRESDLIADFLAEACDLDPAAATGASDLYQHYIGWAQRQGLTERERLSATAFGRTATSRFNYKNKSTGKVYSGLARRLS